VVRGLVRRLSSVSSVSIYIYILTLYIYNNLVDRIVDAGAKKIKIKK